MYISHHAIRDCTPNFATPAVQIPANPIYTACSVLQSDGQTERMNKVLEDMLRHYVNPKQNNWDDGLSIR